MSIFFFSALLGLWALLIFLAMVHEEAGGP